MFNIFFKSCRFLDNVEKYRRSGEAKSQTLWNSLAIEEGSNRCLETSVVNYHQYCLIF